MEYLFRKTLPPQNLGLNWKDWQTRKFFFCPGWHCLPSAILIFAGSLMDIIDMAGWDFYFLIVLLAGSEERVFFSQER